MGFVDWFRRRDDTSFMFDLELFEEASSKTHLKRMAIETCIGLMGRTISQSEFRVRKDRKTKETQKRPFI